ncbi:hypothetical protein Gotri_015582 [Gossypium trilobum]|uniref:Uncharacterized protein n=1 Tax=Gossypium trilobum TaxID=34281 RepID=A0A7J9E0N4_9ROSI|nr:hypothetical protein [Gossypium trilobum]
MSKAMDFNEVGDGGHKIPSAY